MSNALVKAGDTLSFPLAFGIPLVVNTLGGRPYLGLTIDGANARKAFYKETRSYSEGVSGVGACALIFKYTVLPTDPDGVIATATFSANGADITSYAGQDISEENIPFGDTGYEISQAATGYVQELQGLNIGENVSYTGLSGPTNTTLSMRSGVGDGDDLKVEIVSDHIGRWVPKIHSGFFYYKGEELYLFGRKATTTAANVATYRPGAPVISVKLNPTSDSQSYDNTLITHYGPVFVKEITDSGYIPYTYVASALRANIQTTISSVDSIHGTGLYRLRVEGIPVEVRRAATYQNMRRVWNLEGVTSPEDYYVEMEYIPSENGISDIIRYYILVTGDDALYVTYAVSDIVEDVSSTPDPFVQYEVCRLDSNMQIRLMYRDVIAPSSLGHVLSPVISRVTDRSILSIPVLPLGDFSVDNTASINANLITLNSTYTQTINSALVTFTLKPGDEVAVKYYVDNSFTIEDLSDGGIGVQVMSSKSNINTLQVEYEGAPDGWWRGHALKATDSSYTQFNPLKDGIESGFLYITDTSETGNSANKLSITSDAQRPLEMNETDGTSDAARVKVRVVDGFQNPVPYLPISLSLSATGYYFSSLYPLGSTTDWKGELTGTLQAEVAGSVTVTASTTGASGTTAITYYDKSLYLAGTTNATGALGQRIILTTTETSEYAGSIKVMARVSDTSGALPIPNALVVFHARSGRFGHTGTIKADADGVAVAHYYPVVGDEIYATYGSVQSNAIVVESNV